MHGAFLSGLAAVFIGGVCQGTFMAPAKWMRGWAWENYWLIFACVAYLISPWILAFATVPHLAQVYAGIGAGTLAVTLAFGLAWGMGALTFGLGVDAVGMALGFAVILGIAASAGALVPLIVHPPASMTAIHLATTVAGVLLMLAGVAVCSFAGRWKESDRKSGRQSYGLGIAICVASGVLSACGNLGFVFGAQVATRAQSLGAAQTSAGNAVWSLLAIPLFLCNASYSCYLLIRNRTAGKYAKSGSVRNAVLGLLMGALWMAGMSLYGMGAGLMGTLGVSLGWAILMSSMVIVANLVGLSTGEWNGAPGKSKRQLAAGLALLVAAIAVLGYTNYSADAS